MHACPSCVVLHGAVEAAMLLSGNSGLSPAIHTTVTICTSATCQHISCTAPHRLPPTLLRWQSGSKREGQWVREPWRTGWDAPVAPPPTCMLVLTSAFVWVQRAHVYVCSFAKSDSLAVIRRGWAFNKRDTRLSAYWSTVPHKAWPLEL